MRYIKLSVALIALGVAFLAGRYIDSAVESAPAVTDIVMEPNAFEQIDISNDDNAVDFIESRNTTEADSLDSDSVSDPLHVRQLAEPALDPSDWIDIPEIREYEETFAYEPVDTPWAIRSEAKISQGISASGLGLSTIEYQCRSTLCRVRMTHGKALTSDEEKTEMLKGIDRLYRAAVGEDGPPEDIVAASARGLMDEQGREYGNIMYFFRAKPPRPYWLTRPTVDSASE